MRRLIAALCFAASPALADDTTTSAMIADQGLAATLAHLQAQPASPDRDMALAAVTFLDGIEGAYQDRWRVGATMIPLFLPVFGTMLTPNSNPEPLEADFFNVLASDLKGSMQAARAVLPADGGDGALVLDRGDLWFDVNGDGARDMSESLTSLVMLRPVEDEPVSIRFDAADVHWLRAYTHLIEAGATLTLAFDPQPAMARMLDLRAAISDQEMAQLQSSDGFSEMSYYGDMPIYVDTIAVLIQTLRQQPDKALIAETEQHVRQMMAENRAFWNAVAAETDNDREWIPNDNQQAAMGFPVPPGSGAAWLGVLADAERVMDGDLLVPYWRFASGHGLNIREWLDDPQPIDLVSWIQGTDALPYAAKGEVMDGAAWDRFVAMTQGNSGLYMVLFN